MRLAMVALAVVAAQGCAEPRTAADGASVPERQPDGVYFDESPAFPSPQASAPASGIVMLEEPITRAAALALARQYFAAFAHGDVSGFSAIVGSGAKRMDEGPALFEASEDLLTALARRLRGAEYEHFEADEVAAYARARFGLYADIPDNARGRRLLPGDAVLSVPIAQPRWGGLRLFGDEVTFILRREPDGTIRIAGVAEPGASWQ